MEHTISPPAAVSLNARELWRYRELFYFFTWRDIKVKYKQTALGFLWALLQPLLLMATFSLFFHRGLRIPTDGTPPPIFYLSGLLFWSLFASGLTGAANSMIENAQIIKKIYFPRLVIPCSSVLVAGFDFAVALAMFLGMLLGCCFFYPEFSVDFVQFMLVMPLSVGIAVAATLGLGSMLAALSVQYRDFRYVVPFAVQFLFFLTPVLYPLQLIESPGLRYALACNPLTGAIALARSAFSSAPVDGATVGISAAAAVVLLLVGLFIFRKMEAHFADIA
jgi:lipopolysaccharide transport system permease protein